MIEKIPYVKTELELLPVKSEVLQSGQLNDEVVRRLHSVIECEGPITRELLLKRVINSFDIYKVGWRVNEYFKTVLTDFEKYANHDFCNALDDLLPQKLIGAVVERTEIPPHEKVHDVTREQRRRLGQVLKHFSVDIAGPCPVTDAIVTSGGVKIGEIDPKTMASKLVKGLYFAGEIMDVDAYTGGFNLQIAWATGRAAGMAAAEQAPSGQEEEDT